MTQCKECGTAISSKAAACPKCGAVLPKRTSLLTWLVAIVLIPGCIGSIIIGGTSSSKQNAAEAAKSPEQRAAEAANKARDEAEFQRGVRLLRAVKASLNNPDSFKLSSAIVTADGAFCLEYRATNSFNAMVPGYAVLTADDKAAAGSATQVSSLWNKHCASKKGRDMIHIRQAL